MRHKRLFLSLVIALFLMALPGVCGAGAPVLGVDVLPLAAEEAKAAGVTGGLRIVSVAPDGLAAKSQLKANDILLEVNGRPVPDMAALKQVLAGESPQRFKVLRDGAELALDAAQSF